MVTDDVHRPLQNGSAIVQRSIDIGQPVIFVAVNYRYVNLETTVAGVLRDSRRVSIFGFLGGSEVKSAGVGNLGLQDRKSYVTVHPTFSVTYYASSQRASCPPLGKKTHLILRR